jgi:hypothetical protein
MSGFNILHLLEATTYLVGAIVEGGASRDGWP